jgi:nucleotide-binding universal stress UspA family protein
MYHKLLVPLDGSTFGEWALPAALGIARRAGAQLELVTVDVPPPPLISDAGLLRYDSAWASAARDRALAYLEAVAERISRAAGPTVARTVRSGGKVAELLVEHAARVGADLVVMSTHGHGPLKRAWLGSVADAVARHSPVPVLLVRPEGEDGPDLAHEVLFRNVLVPLDGSAYAEEVLTHAVALGEPAGAGYALLEVVVPPYAVGAPVGTFPPHFDPALLEAGKEAAAGYLRGVAERLRRRELRVETLVAVEPFTSAAILEEAERLEVDLIALTTHGRGGLGRLMLGSVADKIVRGARVPVLLYRPRGA